MKRFIKTILVALLLIININVYAEDAWPKTITHNGFTIIIEGFDLRIYKVDTNAETHDISIVTENGVINATGTTDGENYMNEIPTRIINLNPSDFTINPEFTDDILVERNTTFINLNLNITKEKLQELLSEEFNQTNEDRGYMIELVVNYKITELPDKYTFNYKNNFMRDYVVGVGDKTATRALDTTKTNYQVLNFIALTMDSEEDEKMIYYETTIDDTPGGGISAYIYNYQLFSEVEGGADNTKNQVILFHNITNIDKLKETAIYLENFTATIGDFSFDDINPLTSTAVQVPNTAAYKPNIVFLAGGVLILYGIAFLLFATYNNKKKSYNE